MKRREFSTHLMATAMGVSSFSAHSVGPVPTAFVDGTHYAKLGQPIAVSASGKIEVVEFFWYGCPGCNAFEPRLDAWQKKLPADVAFRRMAVALRPDWAVHQRIFFALEAMGLVDTMQRKVFNEIHLNLRRLDNPTDIAAFVTRNGVDGTTFLDHFNSFSVKTKSRQADQTALGYRIDGVPTLGIHGRYFTSPSKVNGNEELALTVADYLMQKVRKGA